VRPWRVNTAKPSGNASARASRAVPAADESEGGAEAIAAQQHNQMLVTIAARYSDDVANPGRGRWLVQGCCDLAKRFQDRAAKFGHRDRFARTGLPLVVERVRRLDERVVVESGDAAAAPDLHSKSRVEPADLVGMRVGQRLGWQGPGCLGQDLQQFGQPRCSAQVVLERRHHLPEPCRRAEHGDLVVTGSTPCSSQPADAPGHRTGMFASRPTPQLIIRIAATRSGRRACPRPVAIRLPATRCILAA
jgi:hypothetical protein